MSQDKPYHVKTWIDDKGFLNISGECSLCGQFPCKHTGFAVTKEFQDKAREVKPKP